MIYKLKNTTDNVFTFDDIVIEAEEVSEFISEETYQLIKESAEGKGIVVEEESDETIEEEPVEEELEETEETEEEPTKKKGQKKTKRGKK